MPGEGEVAVLVDFGGLSSVADREPIRLESDPSEGEPFFGLDPGPAGTPTGREQVGHVDAENGDPNERTGRWCNRKDCGNRALLMKLRPPMNVGLGGCGPRALGLGGGLKKQVKLVALPRNQIKPPPGAAFCCLATECPGTHSTGLLSTMISCSVSKIAFAAGE